MCRPIANERIARPQTKKRQKRRKPLPTPDPWTLFREIGARNPMYTAWDEHFPALLAALEQRARKAPDLFAAELLANILAGGTYLLLRTKMHVEHLIRTADDRGRYQGGPYLPDAVVEIGIPRLLEIGHHLAEIANIQASTARQWTLARAKQWEIEQTQRKAKQPKAHHGVSTNGHSKRASSRTNGAVAPHVNGNGRHVSIPAFQR